MATRLWLWPSLQPPRWRWQCPSKQDLLVMTTRAERLATGEGGEGGGGLPGVWVWRWVYCGWGRWGLCAVAAVVRVAARCLCVSNT